ncbi:uncharacterized protein A4U43_C01F1080 [Asparagus officinalis]|uniref:Uncharacterized protein n=1 Tax=Asparagus officinalis TaxID=4686 RepID=A0A5P1FNB6_ASPOF|nr:uncharacterized protein A4U43_C01F1080 [Asparagus officinalis]
MSSERLHSTMSFTPGLSHLRSIFCSRCPELDLVVCVPKSFSFSLLHDLEFCYAPVYEGLKTSLRRVADCDQIMCLILLPSYSSSSPQIVCVVFPLLHDLVFVFALTVWIFSRILVLSVFHTCSEFERKSVFLCLTKFFALLILSDVSS